MRHRVVKRLQTKFAVVAMLFVAWNALSLFGVKMLRQGLKDSNATRVAASSFLATRRFNELAVRIAAGNSLGWGGQCAGVSWFGSARG